MLPTTEGITPTMSNGEPMTDHTAGQREPSAPSRGSVANHDAVPAAIARTDADRNRTDKAALRPGEGAGNTPAETNTTQPRNGTPAEGTSQSECTEPVAWLVEGCEYDTGCEFQYVALLKEQADAAAAKGARLTPLYRQPPPAAWQLIHDNEWLRDEVMMLKDCIRRLAEQDATLSVCDGNVTVTMDATLTAAERESIREAIAAFDEFAGDEIYAAALRGLLERMR